MIEARDLSRRFGEFTAVEEVSFAVQEGEILGILGPNGAGKTTTIRMITGFLPPTRGRVTLSGHDLFDAPVEARRKLGYLPENVALYPEMRVGEYLAYRARLEGMSRGAARQAISRALERCLLEEVGGQIIGTLSKGYRQRVGLAAAILHDPEVLVLDEPTVGLDPKQIIAIRALIRELGDRHTLLLSTHILPEVELLCDRILIIDRGRIVDQGSPADLRKRWAENTSLRVRLKHAPEGAGEALAALEGARSARLVSPGPVEMSVEEPIAVPADFPAEVEIEVDCESGADLREATFRLAVEKGWTLLELRERKASLEDIFVRLTTDDEHLSRAPGGAGPGAGGARDDGPQGDGPQDEGPQGEGPASRGGEA